MTPDEAAIKQSRILVVDDEPSGVRLLERILTRAGYTRIETTTDPEATLALYDRFQPDLLVLDLWMPGLDGFGVMQRLAAHVPPTAYFPILVLTGDAGVELKRRALSAGAKDFLLKPFDRFEALLRIWNLLETRHLYLAVRGERDLLEDRVRERTMELELAQREVLDRLALAAEFRDDTTGAHVRRVARLSERLARELGLGEREAELIGRAAQLHDVGKIAVPDAIQWKDGPLTPEERELMERHARFGADMLAGSPFRLLQLAESIAGSHHERWDGAGYPDGLAGAAIPLPGRIVAVADALDALTCARPYKPAWSTADALAEIRAGSGTRYDPRVVEALVRLAERGILLERDPHHDA